MWTVTIGVGIYLAVMYQKIPDVIPTHFGLWGQPDSWGSKTSLSLSLRSERADGRDRAVGTPCGGEKFR